MGQSRRLTPKPSYWDSEHAGWFRDPSIVAVYHYRPPYPSRVFDILSSLIVDSPRAVLDIGCGTGDVCRLFAPSVDRVDATDFSAGMIARGKELPGGDGPNIVWIEGAAEEVAFNPPYALITAGESLHWMDWDVVLPRLASGLTENGVLAILDRNWDGPREVRQRLTPIFRRYGAKNMDTPFNLIRGLEERGFRTLGEEAVEVAWRPTIAEYIEARHSQNSFSRNRMGAAGAAAFDAELREALETLCAEGWLGQREGRLDLEVRATVTWGAVHGA